MSKQSMAELGFKEDVNNDIDVEIDTKRAPKGRIIAGMKKPSRSQTYGSSESTASSATSQESDA